MGDLIMPIAEYSTATAMAETQEALAIKAQKLANSSQAAVLALIQSLSAMSDLRFAGIGNELDVTA